MARTKEKRMSWNVQVPDAGEYDEGIGDRLGQAVRDYFAGDGAPSDSPEARDQAEMAVASVLLLSETVGQGRLSVVMSGHANPAHIPAPGYSTDHVSVSVARLSADG